MNKGSSRRKRREVVGDIYTITAIRHGDQLKAEKGKEDMTQDSGWGGQNCLEVGLSEQGCRRGGANLVVERRQVSSV